MLTIEVVYSSILSKTNGEVDMVQVIELFKSRNSVLMWVVSTGCLRRINYWVSVREIFVQVVKLLPTQP